MPTLEERKAQQRVGPADLWNGKPIGGTQLGPEVVQDRRNTRRRAVPQSVFTGAAGPPGPGLPTGTVVDFAGSVVPPGWLECDGTLLGRAAYPALFGVLGTVYAEPGDPEDEFRLPRACGRVLVGCGNDGELLWPLGQKGGETQHVLYDSEVPSLLISDKFGSDSESAATGYESAPGNPHNNLQPYLVLLKIIKT